MANGLEYSLGGAGLFNSLIKSAFAQFLDFTKNKQTKIQNSKQGGPSAKFRIIQNYFRFQKSEIHKKQ